VAAGEIPSAMATYREHDAEALRVLFCIGVSQMFFNEEAARLPELIEAVKIAFDDLQGRFGITVIGTMDDDQLMVGPSPHWPWTAYILADAPSVEAVIAVCNLVREAPVSAHRLWRYLRIEARIGRKLFFGNA
jgi:hypothetical protein